MKTHTTNLLDGDVIITTTPFGARFLHGRTAPTHGCAPGRRRLRCAEARRSETVGMTRLLELIVAIVIVAILALIVGVCLPSTGHIERTATVSKDIRHVYDIFDNFRRFPDYSLLNAYKEGVEYQRSEEHTSELQSR